MWIVSRNGQSEHRPLATEAYGYPGSEFSLENEVLVKPYFPGHSVGKFRTILRPLLDHVIVRFMGQTVGEFRTEPEPDYVIVRLHSQPWCAAPPHASASPQPGDAVPSQWALKRKNWTAPRLQDGTVVPGAWLVPRDGAVRRACVLGLERRYFTT
jgi:hypothetical protein